MADKLEDGQINISLARSHDPDRGYGGIYGIYDSSMFDTS